MLDCKYIVTEVTDRNDNKKANSKMLNMKVLIKLISVGASAILLSYLDGELTTTKTSEVEDIIIWEDTIHIITKNSVYKLKLLKGQAN